MIIYNLLGMLIYAFGFIGLVVCCKGVSTYCGLNGVESEIYRSNEIENFHNIDADIDIIPPPKYEDAINIPLLNDD